MREIKKVFSRTLRKQKTKAENKVWQFLRDRKFKNMKFRRQHVIEGFVIDFFCKEYNLGIEVDGSIHKSRKEYDEIRQQIIESEGVKIIRISNEDVSDSINILFNKIEKAINIC